MHKCEVRTGKRVCWNFLGRNRKITSLRLPRAGAHVQEAPFEILIYVSGKVDDSVTSLLSSENIIKTNLALFFFQINLQFLV